MRDCDNLFVVAVSVEFSEEKTHIRGVAVKFSSYIRYQARQLLGIGASKCGSSIHERRRNKKDEKRREERFKVKKKERERERNTRRQPV